MKKTISIGDKDIVLENNVVWAMEYRNQFGRDILPVFMPLLIGGIDIVKELLEDLGKTKEIGQDEVLTLLNSDAIIEAILHLSNLEVTDLINITWAMAKAADDDIPEPLRWVREFDTFPVDVIAPAVIGLCIDGMVSSKNLERLKKTIRDLRPKSNLTILSSQVSNED